MIKCVECGADTQENAGTAENPLCFSCYNKLSLQSGYSDKKCPRCAETVLYNAVKCRYCGYDFTNKLTKSIKYTIYALFSFVCLIVLLAFFGVFESNSSSGSNKSMKSTWKSLQPILINANSWDSLDVLQSLLDSSDYGGRWRRWYSFAPCTPIVTKDPGGGSNIAFKERGIIVCINDSDVIESICLTTKRLMWGHIDFNNANGSNLSYMGCANYSRALPYGLSFDYDQATVENIIGIDGIDTLMHKFYSSWNSKGIAVHYTHKIYQPEDAQNIGKVEDVTIFVPH